MLYNKVAEGNPVTLFVTEKKGIYMKITLAMRGTMKKKYGAEERILELPEGSTCHDALMSLGIDYRDNKTLGFVSVNSLRVDIHTELHDGDYMKAFSKVYGG